MQLIGHVQGPFVNISGYLPRWYAMTASAERLKEVETFRDDGSMAEMSGLLQWYQRDFEKIGLRQARFAYPASTDEPSPAVLDGLDLEIRKGETVAFIGHSGCGKSTVLKLLMCMYPLEESERYVTASGRESPLTAY